MFCAKCKVAIAYAPFDCTLPSYLVAVYMVEEASAVPVFVPASQSCNSTMEAGAVAVVRSAKYLSHTNTKHITSTMSKLSFCEPKPTLPSTRSWIIHK